MDERKLIEKLLRIEALHSGAATQGERVISQAIHEDSSEAAERKQIAPPAR